MPSAGGKEKSEIPSRPLALANEASSRKPSYYQERLGTIYRTLIPEGMRVLQVGCSRGDLLAALRPSRGLGLDPSEKLVAVARKAHPECEFIAADEDYSHLSDETFDYLVLADVVLDLADVQGLFRSLRRFCHPGSRIILNSYSRLWRGPLRLARSLRLARPRFGKNWLDTVDLKNLLFLEGFETIRIFGEILWPVRTPLIAGFVNRYIAKIRPFRHFDVTNVIVARPEPHRSREKRSVSIVVPARNEAGNISRIIDTLPELGTGTEIVFVEGGSSDNTFEVIKQEAAKRPDRPIVFLQQAGKGKGDAVRAGFAAASGEILMIYDADLTVPVEMLDRFYEALARGKAELANGVRLVYPMDQEAMRFLNLCGNKFFALAFSWVLGQGIKDTLCGTKALSRETWDRIVRNRSFFGKIDPFGDFDLILGAARQSIRIVDIPIRYGERTYGETNISRFSDGWLLLRMLLLAARRLKFV